MVVFSSGVTAGCRALSGGCRILKRGVQNKGGVDPGFREGVADEFVRMRLQSSSTCGSHA